MCTTWTGRGPQKASCTEDRKGQEAVEKHNNMRLKTVHKKMMKKKIFIRSKEITRVLQNFLASLVHCQHFGSSHIDLVS